jgi:hypothetical protein
MLSFPPSQRQPLPSTLFQFRTSSRPGHLSGYNRHAANNSNRLASNGLRPPLVSARSMTAVRDEENGGKAARRFLPPESSGRGVPAAAFRTGGWDPLLGVLDPVRDPGPAARGTSGPENQEPVAVPEATSDPGTPEQKQDLAGTALVRVAAEWSWCSPSAPLAFSDKDFRLRPSSTKERSNEVPQDARGGRRSCAHSDTTKEAAK